MKWILFWDESQLFNTSQYAQATQAGNESSCILAGTRALIQCTQRKEFSPLNHQQKVFIGGPSSRNFSALELLCELQQVPGTRTHLPTFLKKRHELNYQMDQLVKGGWMEGREHVFLLLEEVR